jgi:hypothetical protein
MVPARRSGLRAANDRDERERPDDAVEPRSKAGWLFFESPSRFIFLVEHDVLPKTGTHFSASCSDRFCYQSIHRSPRQ